MITRPSLLRLLLLLAMLPGALRGQSSLNIKLDANATVTEVSPGGAGDKAKLMVGDTITGLQNRALTGGRAEIMSTLAKMAPDGLLPITISRAGHPMTLLAFPTAGSNTAAAPGPAAVTGHYSCLTFTFFGGGLSSTPSSLYTGIDLLSNGSYSSLKTQGRYHSEVSSGRLVFKGGVLANSVAHLKADSKGIPEIVFAQKENQHAIDGHQIDLGPTTCYLKK